MIRKEEYMKILALHEHGVYQKDIAEELGVHPKTVSRALQRQGAPPRATGEVVSKLSPYQAQVDQLLASGVWNGRVIWRKLQGVGYQGGYTMVRRYIAPKRALRGQERASRLTVRFETKAGEQLQSDWGEIVTEIAGKATKVYFIVNTLGYSRRFHFWCSERMDAEHTYEGLIRSFEYFDGVTEEVLVDNQKSAVLVASNTGQTIFQPRFEDLAGHYGFRPRACRPYRARTKGKDERMVGYIKHNFFVRYRSFDSWAHLNQLAEQWLREEADLRLHGTLKEVVSERFVQEQPHLKPLPTQRYDTSYLEIRTVAWDSYIDVRGNRYSVPSRLAGQRVTVRIGLDESLRIYHAEQLVATHTLQSRQQGWVTVTDHHATLWQSTLNVEERDLAVYAEVAQWN
jgi:transposase